MKKVEMESHRKKYRARLKKARKAQREGLYRATVELALSAWDYVDGMMQYERKYGDGDFTSIEALDMVLKYAPLLLNFSNLDKLESLLKTQRRIEKYTADDLGETLAKSRALMWCAHRMWNHLESHGETRQDQLARILGGDQAQWRGIAEGWEKMGLLRRKPEGGSYRLTLATRMGEVVSGKCPSCGGVAEAPKSMFFEESTCPQCQATGCFVLLARESDIKTKG